MHAPNRPHLSRLLVCGVVSLLCVSTLLTACGGNGPKKSTATGPTKPTLAPPPDQATTTIDGGPTTTDRPDPSGGSGTDASTKDYEDAAARVFMAQSGNHVTEEQAGCLAEQVVAAVRTERFVEAGVTPEKFEAEGLEALVKASVRFTEDEANDMFDSYADCGVSVINVPMRQYEGLPGITDKQLQCLRRIVTVENLRRRFVDTAVGRHSSDDPLDRVTSCLKAGTGGGTGSATTLP